MSDGSGGERGEALGGEHIATYREIAARWGLAGVDVARLKAKRAGWRQLPRNHPADPVRVAIPRAAWDAAGVIGGRANGLDREAGARARSGEDAPLPSGSAAPPPSRRAPKRDKGLARALATLHELREHARSAQVRAAQAEAVAVAERDRVEAAAAEAAAARADAETLRTEVMRATAEVEALRTERDRIAAERDRVAAERDALRAEVAAWTAGGRWARAWRAFLGRR